MKTIALRFVDKFAPESGTIFAHQEVINKIGYVWYGKFGRKISDKILQEILKKDTPKILLINSGKTERYWAYINNAQNVQPPLSDVPNYYRNNAKDIITWFCITKFERATKDVMANCIVVSSKNLLSNVSKHSMNSHFLIEFNS